MKQRPVVPQQEWKRALESSRVKEKQATRERDALAAERRRLPRVRIEKEYAFESPSGRKSLRDLFDGRRQLLLYHFMFGPSRSAGCPGCSLVVDQICHPAHLHARDVAFALVSRAPIAKVFGLSVFLREGDDVLRTYFTTHRGVEALGNIWSLLDITPFGRQEEWEDSPEGTPQGPPYAWWRRHDEY